MLGEAGQPLRVLRGAGRRTSPARRQTFDDTAAGWLVVADGGGRLTDRWQGGIPWNVNPPRALHVVLHQPEIPQNTGNIGRTCVAIGAKLWLVRPLGFRLDDRYLKRAGLDYWPHLDWEAVDDWDALAGQLPLERAWYFTRFATRSYVGPDYQPGDVLVFGSETAGLPPSITQGAPDRCLRVPMRAEVRSLNLSNTVAVAAYEAIRNQPPFDHLPSAPDA